MLVKKIKAIAKVCRFNEVLLVVPYAGAAAFMASSEIPDIARVIFILLACFAGFSVGQVFNAFADKDIDAKVPRTAERPLVKKELSTKETMLVLLGCVAVVLLCTAALNWFYVLLLPIPVAICLVYSLCKRFTWCGHFVLGVAHAICPVAGWIVFGSWKDWRAILFGAVVFFWTFSLDMIYSQQDMKFDKEMGLYSIPAVFGEKVADVLSFASHLITVVLYAVLIYVANCGMIFIALAIVAECLLITQYLLIWRDKRNAKYAFNLNQAFSLIIFVASILDKI